MNGHNLWACIRWEPTGVFCGCHGADAIALCEHDGCPWTSTAPTEQQQISAFIVHHTNHHGDDR